MSTDSTPTVVDGSDEDFITDESRMPDALGDADRARQNKTSKNFARVGSQRPSSLMFTYGPGSIIDLPNFTVMPLGLRAWESIYKRRGTPQTIDAPRLLDTVQLMLGPQVRELREFPWAPTELAGSREGDDLGVQGMVFPQWFRCTGCDQLGPLGKWTYRNERRQRPDMARFTHDDCKGRQGGRKKTKPQPVVPARYLLACIDGHLDEFPYDWWVHEGVPCPKAKDAARLQLRDLVSGGGNAVITCLSCDATRMMSEARGTGAESKLPRCRGRHPHLDGFDRKLCDEDVRLMLVGASSLWFPAVASVIVMPDADDGVGPKAEARVIADQLGDEISDYIEQPKFLRRVLREAIDVDTRSDEELLALARLALEPEESDEDRLQRRRDWDPVDLLVPEWTHLQHDPQQERSEHERSGLILSPRQSTADAMDHVSRVLAVDQLRKVNALLGFTRIDEFDRVTDSLHRLVRLHPHQKSQRWTVATKDLGEGIFLQLDEDAVSTWETRVEGSALWVAHVEAHRHNFANRYSETSGDTDHMTRMQTPRYWLVHTLAHLLVRRMAMSSGYGGASISERIYAWQGTNERDPAAGVLLCTTASDSEGTLGGLVRLSDADLLPPLLASGLDEAKRCSSDPVCSGRTPKPPEDFLHGAACHCCLFLPETACERSNRFLDRRFVVPLPGPYRDLAFLGDVR